MVRLGIKRPDDPNVLSTIKVVDRQLSSVTPNGRFWHRYTDDGYGEQRNGAPWDVNFPPGSQATIGRMWPIFAGERGEYELAAGHGAGSQLASIAATANDGGMLPEQVWDQNPPSGQPGFAPGPRRSRRRRWPGPTPSSSAWPGRSPPDTRLSSRRSWPAGTCASASSGSGHSPGRPAESAAPWPRACKTRASRSSPSICIPIPTGRACPYEADLTDADANAGAVKRRSTGSAASTSSSPMPACSTLRPSRSSPSSAGSR